MSDAATQLRSAIDNSQRLRAITAHCEVINQELMPLWSVYRFPPDDPGHYVARLFIVMAGKYCPSEVSVRATTLDAVRALLPPDLFRVARDTTDAPAILESWI